MTSSQATIAAVTLSPMHAAKPVSTKVRESTLSERILCTHVSEPMPGPLLACPPPPQQTRTSVLAGNRACSAYDADQGPKGIREGRATCRKLGAAGEASEEAHARTFFRGSCKCWLPATANRWQFPPVSTLCAFASAAGRLHLHGPGPRVCNPIAGMQADRGQVQEEKAPVMMSKEEGVCIEASATTHVYLQELQVS